MNKRSQCKISSLKEQGSQKRSLHIEGVFWVKYDEKINVYIKIVWLMQKQKLLPYQSKSTKKFTTRFKSEFVVK